MLLSPSSAIGKDQRGPSSVNCYLTEERKGIWGILRLGELIPTYSYLYRKRGTSWRWWVAVKSEGAGWGGKEGGRRGEGGGKEGGRRGEGGGKEGPAR